MSEFIERELGWDDEISYESEFVLIPAGDYNFTVTGFERARYAGGQKLPPCNQAIVTCRIDMPDGTTQNIKHNLFLHSKCEGMLSEFFVGLGLKRKGEPLKMNWNAVTGAKGRCKVGIHTWKNSKTGEDMQSNEIKKFYEPSEPTLATTVTTPATSAPGGVYTPGQF